jgi:hypothetical protein
MTELFNCDFNNSFSDSSERHGLIYNSGALFSGERKVGISSGYFNGNSYLAYDGNREDFSLGSTPVTYNNTQGNMSLPDNSFTLECWVKLETGAQRYYPICSSFNFMVGSLSGENGSLWPYKCGWVLQVDTTTGTLQMIGYAFGNWTGSVLQSPRDSVYFNTWTHIAIQSWNLPNSINYKLIYINGTSILPYPVKLDNCSWTNTFTSSMGVTRSLFYIGVGPRSQFTNPEQSWWYDLNQDQNSALNYRFKGRIDSLGLYSGNKYNEMTFTPDGGNIPPLLISPSQDSVIYLPDGMSNTSETSILPVMDSSYDSSIAITGSGDLGSDVIVGAFRAFDRNLNTCWQVSGAGPAIMLINLGDNNKKAINKYRMFCIDKDLFPSEWTIEGSNDKVNWTLLTEVEDYLLAISGFWTEWFYFSNGTPYQYYRISTNIPPYTAKIKIGEIKLVEAEKYTTSPTSPSSTMTGFIRLDPGGIPIASSYIAEGEPSRAFDDNDLTTWLPMTYTNQWIGVKLNNYYKVTKIGLKVKATQTFNSWIFQGSNDGHTWTTLYNGAFSFQGTQYFDISNSTFYQYYRVFFTEWAGLPGLEGMELWATNESITEYTLSTTTDSSTSTSTTSVTQTTTTTLTFTTSNSSITSFSSTLYNANTTQPPESYRNITKACSVINANSYYIDHLALNAINENLENYWACSVHSGPPYWLALHFSAFFSVDEYVVYLNESGLPKSWTFQGSLDNTTWDTLHTITNNTRHGKVINRMSNSNEYSHYRFHITSMPEDELDVRIDQIQLFINSKDYNLEADMHYIGYQYNNPVIVKRYCLCTKDTSTFTEWKLQGSSNGIIWTDVDARKEPEFIGWKCIEIDNTLSYSFWRVLVMKWGTFSVPGLTEVEFYGETGV